MHTMKNIFYTLSSSLLLTVPYAVFAQADGSGTNAPAPVNISVKINNPFSGGDSLSGVITTILQKIVMPLAAVFVVLAIIYSGFKYVMAQGNPQQIKEANKGLVAVLIGTAILLGATGISAALQGTLCQIFSSVNCN